MRRLIGLRAAVISFLLLTSFAPPPAHAASPLVVISDIFHREVNGKFTDDSLGESISIDGALYNRVINAPKTATWVIDPQLIEELNDMSDGYTVLPDNEGSYRSAADTFLSFSKRESVRSNSLPCHTVRRIWQCERRSLISNYRSCRALALFGWRGRLICQYLPAYPRGIPQTRRARAIARKTLSQ